MRTPLVRNLASCEGLNKGMCGFVGFVGRPGALGGDEMKRLAARMADRLESRGPDDAGTWVSPSAGIALGHRRLAVIDLTTAGRQPMVSASGRSVIAYNGEVYNFGDIRRELEAEKRRFRGNSDTEVLLEACEAWGVEHAVSKLIGMFAFAFWDDHARRLTLVRDRLGIKPLYWGRCGGVLFLRLPTQGLRRPSRVAPGGRSGRSRGLPQTRLRARATFHLQGYRETRAGLDSGNRRGREGKPVGATGICDGSHATPRAIGMPSTTRQLPKCSITSCAMP